ncbi:MAG: AraC family transcriptional regulator [Verrucomicrobiales bacterium]|jgi:AraC family L-rhamnose operon regulatory protein RhaS|nr:AraC family transcriptional regulator [Verrucomicrobiales bacterium]
MIFEIDPCRAQKQAIKDAKIRFYGLTHGHYPGIKLPPEALPGLKSLGFWDAVGTQDWRMEPHRNDGLEIVLLETGGMDFAADDELFQLAPGTLTVTCPWQWHCHGTSRVGPGRLHWLILDVRALTLRERWQWPEWIVLQPADLCALTESLRGDSRCVHSAGPELISAFQKISAGLQAGQGAGFLSQVIVSVNQILLGLLGAIKAPRGIFQVGGSLTERVIGRFFRELAMNGTRLAEPWTLERMAGRCGVGCTMLVNYCKRLTNTTPMDYLNRCRLEWAAAELVRRPAENITGITYRAGFSSSAYFATQFKRRYGLTPREYRRRRLPR